jgi:hypothetical protein
MSSPAFTSSPAPASVAAAASSQAQPPSAQQTQSDCPDFVSLANVFAKNKLGFSSEAKAPYRLAKHLSLSFVTGQSFVPELIRGSVPMPCVTLGPFAALVNGVKLSCAWSTKHWPNVPHFAAASTNWNLVGENMGNFCVYKHHRCHSALDLPAPNDDAVLQPCGAYTGLAADLAKIELIHARISHGHHRAGFFPKYFPFSRHVVSRVLSANCDMQHLTMKAFYGEKRIYMDSSCRDSVSLDAGDLQAWAREAPFVSLSGVQLVAGAASGAAVVLRHSFFTRTTDKIRVSIKLPIYWTSRDHPAHFLFSCAQAQRVTLSTPFFQHSCNLGIGFKLKNWAPSVFLVYF